MKYKSLLVAGVFLASAVAMPALADHSTTHTIEQLQAQIATLIQQIKALQAQQGQDVEWCHTFDTNLRIDNHSDEVRALGTALEKEGFGKEYGAPISDDGVFIEDTAAAVTGFQQKYRDEILTPAGLKYGTGFVGPRTRAKLNQLYRCGDGGPPPIIPPIPPPPPIPPIPPVTVLSPNGGEMWAQGSQQVIAWKSTTQESFFARINLTGASYSLIFSQTPNDGSESWLVPSTIPTGNYRISVSLCRSNNDCFWNDFSDAPFSIIASNTGTSQNLDLNSDGSVDGNDSNLLADIIMGNASCPAGKNCNVNNDGAIDAKDVLEYWFVNTPYDLNDDGAVTSRDNVYLVNVINGFSACPSGKKCDTNSDGKINVYDLTALNKDNASESCVVPSTLNPSGSITAPADGKINLSWSSVPDAAHYAVRLDDGSYERYDDPRYQNCLPSGSPHYYCENGIVGTSVTGIPVKPGRTYKYWVAPIYYPARNDCPHTPTTITVSGGATDVATVKVLSPNGGEVWQSGVKQLITWTTNPGIASNANLYLKAVASGNTYIIAQNVALNNATDKQIYYWIPVGPYEKDTQFTIRACRTDNSLCDESDAPFSIIGSGASQTDLAVAKTELNSTGVTANFCNYGVAVSSFPVSINLNGIVRDFDLVGVQTAGACQTHTWTYGVWGLTYTVGKSYHAAVQVDPKNIYQETNENNNLATADIAGLEEVLAITSPALGEKWIVGATNVIRWNTDRHGQGSHEAYLLSGACPGLNLQTILTVGSKVCNVVARIFQDTGKASIYWDKAEKPTCVICNTWQSPPVYPEPGSYYLGIRDRGIYPGSVFWETAISNLFSMIPAPIADLAIESIRAEVVQNAVNISANIINIGGVRSGGFEADLYIDDVWKAYLGNFQALGPRGVTVLKQSLADQPLNTSRGVKIIIRPQGADYQIGNNQATAGFYIYVPPTTQPSITVLSPASGSVINSWSPTNINWQSTGLASGLNINLRQFNGSEYTNIDVDGPNGSIASNLAPTSQSYSWQIPSHILSGSRYLITVCGTFPNATPSYVCVNGPDFSIQTPFIKVTNPQANATLVQNQPYTITWDAAGIASEITLKLMKNNVITQTIGTVGSLQRTYSWTPTSTSAVGTGTNIFRIYIGGTTAGGQIKTNLGSTFSIVAPTAQTSVKIKNVRSQKCLDIRPSDEYVIQNTCNSLSNTQNWQFVQSSGAYLIKSVASGKCVDIKNANYSNETRLIAFGCHGGLNQQWKFVHASSSSQITSVPSGKNIDIPNASTADGVKAQIYSAHGGLNQQFTFEGLPAGTVLGASTSIYNPDPSLIANLKISRPDLGIYNSDGPVSLPMAGSITLEWNAPGATSCTIEGTNFGFLPASGSHQSTTITSKTNFSLLCTNGVDYIGDEVVVDINSSEGVVLGAQNANASLLAALVVSVDELLNAISQLLSQLGQ